MTLTEAAELLDLVTERAPALRDAGVARVALGDLAFELAPAAPPAADQAKTEEAEEEEEGDVLRSPWTFGRPGRDAPKRIAIKRTKL
jgi:hypothetical protein